MKVHNFSSDMFSSKNKLYSFVNPYSYEIIKKNRDKFKDKFVFFADGISFVKIYNFFHDEKIQRYSFDFTSLAPVVFAYAVENNSRVVLIGGKDKEVNSTTKLLMKKYPGLNICYYSHGYIKDNISDVINNIKKSKAEIVIAGLGTPFQEEFLLQCENDVPSLQFGFTCGGFISQVSGNENYFHPFFDKLHLRWLQRFYRHSYVRKRVLKDYPLFFVNYIRDNFKNV